MSTLGAQKVHTLSLHYPETGAWRADVVLTNGAAPAEGSRLTLTAVDLPCLGTVLRADTDAPERPHVVLVGGLGWDAAMAAPPSYQADAGVRLSTVLKDLAARAGEPFEYATATGTPLPDVVIGDHWSCPAARPGEPLRVRDALAALFEQGFAPPWRVDPDGVTRFGLRVGGAVTARATVLRRDAGVGLTVIGLDSPAAFLPGALLNGRPVRRLIVTETPGNLTAEVWGDTRLSFRSRILRMVAEAFPALVYGYPRTYRVAALRLDGDGNFDGRIDLAPPPDAAHLAPLPAVEQWTIGGAEVIPLIGSSVVVAFRDALPSRPVIVAYERARASKPQAVTVDASSKIRVGFSAGEVDIGGVTRPASGAGHLAARVFRDSVSGIVYVSESVTAPYSWAPVASGIIPPTIADAGTAVTIAEGSAKVNIG